MGFDALDVNGLLVRTRDGRNVCLCEELVYNAKDGVVYIVPIGSTSDGASTPRFIWNIIPPFGKYFLAAVLHDHLYRNTHFPKELCDNLLYEACMSLGDNHLEAWEIYEGVHLGGHSSFNTDRLNLAAREAGVEIKD